MNRRTFGGLVGSVALPSIAGCTASHPLPTPGGVVLARRVEAGSETLLDHDAERLEIDSPLSDLVERERAVLSEEAETTVRTDRGPIEYSVRIEHTEPTGLPEDPGDVVTYAVPRAVFNRVLPDDGVRFHLLLHDQSELLSVSRIDRVGRITEKRVLDPDGEAVIASTTDGSIRDVAAAVETSGIDPDDATFFLLGEHGTDQLRDYEPVDRSVFESASAGEDRRLTVGSEGVVSAVGSV
ncbi:hypothetical protein [Natronorarus salvus]|uniref:hypothetical protein n=1 Tax=Natronorarus salvus TaxID=3117733 RepID=UPI002F2671B9